MRPLQDREAQRSSRLEGTITDPQQQALFQADPRYPKSRHDPNNALREVYNYARALQLHLAKQDELPLSLRLIRELHAVLMDGVRGAEQDPGNFRRVQNQIGRPPRFVPPPVDRLGQCLDDFEKYLHQPKALDPLVEAFIAHYQFEAIHPFRDGNGRVGRLLLALTIAEWCDLSEHWLYMSAYFEKNEDAYLDLLFRVSTHGDWRSWVEFCLQGVVEQARDTQQRCDQLVDLSRRFHEQVRAVGGSVRLASIVDKLFESPVAIVTNVQREFGVTYPTARADLKKLETAGILRLIEGYRQIAYYCEPIYEVTHAD